MLDGPNPVQADVSIAVADSAGAVAAVSQLADAGVDFIKVYTLLPADAFRAVIAEAARRGLPVAGHAPAAVGVMDAAASGMRTIEHLTSELGGFCDSQDAAQCDAVITTFRAAGTWLVPTLGVQGHPPPTALCGDPRITHLPLVARQYWFGASGEPVGCDTSGVLRPPYMPALSPEAALVRLLRDAGLPIVTGTDAGVPFAFPGSSLHDEMQLLVQAGLTPAAAVRAATWEAARALGREAELGAIRPGYRADMVLLAGDPLQSIGNTRRIESVVFRGRAIARAGLERPTGP
jgi:imidazolonepropionase-like amidohydrolase